jgi:Fe-S cluster assembly protein SufD
MDTLEKAPGLAPAAVESLVGALAAIGNVPVKENPPWLKPIRAQARQNLQTLGFPTTRHEEWRFTNISPLLQLPLHPAAANGRQLTAGDLAPFRIEADGPCLVFVDGWFREDLSSAPKQKGGLQLASLRAGLAGVASELEAHLARHAACHDSFFTALNTAFFEDGAFVSVPAGLTVDQPVQLLYVTAASSPGAVVQARTLILAGAGSSLKIVESYISMSDAPHFTNAVTELVLETDARVEHCRLQNENERAFHVSTVQAVQARGSHWISHSVAAGARLARNQVQTLLGGECAEAIQRPLFGTPRAIDRSSHRRGPCPAALRKPRILPRHSG